MVELRQPPVIDAFGGGGFRIAGQRHAGSVLILDDMARPWPVHALAALEPHHLHAALTAPVAAVELVLLGVGPSTALVPRPVREAAAAANVGLEVMSTPEACRLYNYLAGEGRRVAAALIAV